MEFPCGSTHPLILKSTRYFNKWYDFCFSFVIPYKSEKNKFIFISFLIAKTYVHAETVNISFSLYVT